METAKNLVIESGQLEIKNQPIRLLTQFEIVIHLLEVRQATVSG